MMLDHHLLTPTPPTAFLFISCRSRYAGRLLLHHPSIGSVRGSAVREFAEARFVNLLDMGKLMRPQPAVLAADHPLVQV